jgi:glycogen operon protein
VRDDSFLVLLNSHHEQVEFRTPDTMYGAGWRTVVDTAALAWPEEVDVPAGAAMKVESRSLLVLIRTQEPPVGA